MDPLTVVLWTCYVQSEQRVFLSKDFALKELTFSTYNVTLGPELSPPAIHFNLPPIRDDNRPIPPTPDLDASG